MLYKDSRNSTHNTSVEHKGMIKNGKHTKRSSSQTGKRLTRPHRSAVPKHTTNARIPNHNQNTQKLRSILATLEKKGYVNSQWNMNNERPRKTYNLTTEGQTMLNFTENSLNLLCQKIGTNSAPQMNVEACTAIPNLTKRTRFISTH
jgi:predicted transcriptional regulator